jgi:hypothetical protein
MKGVADTTCFCSLWVLASINKIYSSTTLPNNFGISFAQRHARVQSLAPISNIMSETNTARVNKTSDFSTSWTDIFAMNLCKYKFGIPRRDFTFLLYFYVSYLRDFSQEVPIFYLMLSVKTGHVLQTRADSVLQTLTFIQPYLNRLPMMLHNITSMCLLNIRRVWPCIFMIRLC